jgi:outer membrane receptor protein involved in Fe transport
MQKRDYLPGVARNMAGAGVIQASTGKAYVEASARQMQSVDASQSLTLGDIVLKDIVVESKAHIEEPFRLHNQADVVLKGSQLPVPPSGNILEVLQGRVAGLQIHRRGFNDFQAVIRGQGQPLYLIDGMPVDPSALSSINAFDVDRIEIIKNMAGAAIYGGRAGGGVIAFYTKRGGTNFEEVDENGKKFIIIHRAAGYARQRQFYSPQYEAAVENKLPDLRTTLYWNPAVKTDAAGKARVSFYTADRETQYRAIVEGISQEGTPGRSESVFGVTDNGQASRK